MNIINDVLVDKLFKDKPKRTKEIPLLEEKSVSGESIIIGDAYPDMPFKGLHVYGKSTQVTTTGANLLPFIVGTKGVGFEVFDDGIWINAGANVDVYAVGKNDSLVESGYSEYDLMPPGDYWSYIDNSELLLYIVVWRDGKSVVLNASNGSVVKNTILDGDKFRLFIRTKNAFTGKVKAIISKAPINPDLYEPYTGGKPSPSIEYPQEITSSGDKGEIGVSVYGGNLIPETQIVDVSFNKKDNGTHYGYSEWINVVPNNTYIFNENMIVKIVDTLGNTLFNGQTVSKKVIIPHDGVRLKCRTVFGIDILGSDFKLMMNIGDKILPFEPYKEPQTLTLSTPNGLPGIPVSTGGNYTDSKGQQWVCDEIDLARGKYVQRTKRGLINKVTSFNGVPKNGLVEFLARTENSYKGDAIGILCNKLMGTHESKERIVQGYGLFYIRLSTSRFKNGDNLTIEEANEFFKKNPLDVIYILETPIETDLTPEEITAYKALHTNYPTTTIVNDENAGMKVTYLTPSFIPTRESALRMWFKENPII